MKRSGLRDEVVFQDHGTVPRAGVLQPVLVPTCRPCLLDKSSGAEAPGSSYMVMAECRLCSRTSISKHIVLFIWHLLCIFPSYLHFAEKIEAREEKKLSHIGYLCVSSYEADFQRGTPVPVLPPTDSMAWACFPALPKPLVSNSPCSLSCMVSQP
jgi:hypothetical protein